MHQRISALTRVLNPLRLTRYARSSTPLDFETPVPLRTADATGPAGFSASSASADAS